MPAELKYEIGIALLALIQIVTTILRERWARQRDSKQYTAIVQVQDSLRPPQAAPSPDRGSHMP